MKDYTKLKRAVIKEEFIAITGDFQKAVILNQFIYWAERVKDFDEFTKQENERSEKYGFGKQDLSNGWIYKTAEELAQETMLGLSPASMRSHIKALVDLGFISERQNPKYKWDRTKQYRVNLVEINEALKSKDFTFEGYNFNVPFLEIKNGNNENQNAIPKNTTKITTQDTINNNTRFKPPTIEEVKAYCQERKNNVDPERFINYYTSNGWQVGKHKMKDWKAAIRTWEKNNFNSSQTKKGANGIAIDNRLTDDLDGIM